MENKSSPFGNVCGIHLRGTMQDNGRTVQLSVYLISDAGLTERHVAPQQKGQGILWGEMGDVTYQMRLEESGVSEVIVLLSYLHDVEERTLMSSVVVHFVPHGWVKLKDVSVPLNREAPTTELQIPGDITEEKLNTTPRSNDNIESIYGLRLANRDTVLKYHNHFEKRPRHDAKVSVEDDDDDEETHGAKKIKPTPTLVAVLPSLPHDFSSFARQRELSAERELKYAKDVAVEWEQPLRDFFKGILADPFRVRDLVRMWHSRLIPIATTTISGANGVGVVVDPDRTSPVRIFHVFMNSLLYAEKMLELTETHLYLFNPAIAPSLGIALSWLTTDEQIFCNRIYVHRARLFQRRHEPDASRYRLSRFWLDKLVVETAFCTRFVVYQFALDCIDCTLRARRPIVLLTLISAAGRLYVENPRDPFVARLKMALEKPSIKSAVEEMGMFVRIGLSGGCEPDYEPAVWQRGKGDNGHRVATTPYRLVPQSSTMT